jgi:glycyl-tRNA synthetase
LYTIDFDPLSDRNVTIRERDTLHQIRIPLAELVSTLKRKLEGEEFYLLPQGGKVWK